MDLAVKTPLIARHIHLFTKREPHRWKCVPLFQAREGLINSSKGPQQQITLFSTVYYYPTVQHQRALSADLHTAGKIYYCPAVQKERV